MAAKDASGSFLGKQYARTMRKAYAFARDMAVVQGAGDVLDCGSSAGHEWELTFGCSSNWAYHGVEWFPESVAAGVASGLDIRQCDLNGRLPFENDSMDLVIAYSVLEHLLMPCHFLRESKRVLRSGGRVVILTPNIATYFTALQLLLGRMPSSGPHPDSSQLLESAMDAHYNTLDRGDISSDTPEHRHLVVFSYKVLRRFLRMAGFEIVAARGFGWYPLPGWMQAPFEQLDAAHCHQMVFVGKKI